MTTLSQPLTPERCHQLRNGGILKLLINLLHEHTFEPHDQSEADVNLDQFLLNFNGKAQRRRSLSHQIRVIIEHTGDRTEVAMLNWLEAIRSQTERLYAFINKGPELTDLSESPDKHNLILYTLTDKERPAFELLGGVFAILDYLRAHNRVYAKSGLFIEPIHSPVSVILDSRSCGPFSYGLAVLNDFMNLQVINKESIIFLHNSRSFHELLVTIIKYAVHDNKLRLVDQCFFSIYCLTRFYLKTERPAKVCSEPYLRDCGVIKCFAELLSYNINPVTLRYMLQALDHTLLTDPRNIFAFCSIHDAVGKLLDVLVPSEEKDNDVKNATLYAEHRQIITCCLNTVQYCLHFYHKIQDNRFLKLLESRDIALLFGRHLVLATPIDYALSIECVLPLLADILYYSKDQRSKFAQIDGAIEAVEEFLYSPNEATPSAATRILKLF